MNIKYYMKYIALIAILVLCIHGDRRIVSRPIESTYNQYGRVDGLIIQWKCYETIYSYDYLKLTLPQPIHDASLSIKFSLQTANSKNIIILHQSLAYVGANTYYLPMQNNLTADVWYELKIYLTKPLTISYGLLELMVVSKPTAPSITYAWNNGFEYYHLQQNNTPVLGSLSLNFNSTPSTSAGSRYSVLLQLQSDVSIDEQVMVTIDFVDYALSTNITIDTVDSGNDKGFMFVGSCSTKCPYNDTYHTCIHQDKCQATPTAVMLTLPYMKTNQIYLVEVFVVNPTYVSNVGLEAYWKDNDGKTVALAFASIQLEVLPITVNPEQIRLLWNIPYQTVVNQMKLGLFINDPTQKHQSLSSFDIGFSVSAVTPVEDQYEVRITVGATSVLESSINHNLPSFRSTTRISCRYSKPDIICINVDAFVLKNYRYYVRARGYFTTADTLTSFGNVAIASLSQPHYLFVNLVRNLAVTSVINADYHDYGGLHEGTSNFRIQETIVSSHNDTLLPNSTTKSIDDFLYSSNGLVGVDPSITPQQLLFFMKVNLNQMSRPSPSSFGQNYTMKIFTNPNIMNTSNLGIDFVAYSSVTKAWDVMHAPCYVDSSTTPTIQQYMCQKYNDHVYGRQVDNTYSKTTNYGLYTSVCGAGQLVTCPSGDCSNACRILRGGFSSGAMTTGSAGVLSIRNVTFTKSYQAPIEAGPNNFDFVIAFYHDNVLVSSSLINAYTVNKTRLQNVRADVVNHYHDNTVTNAGNRLPTLLKISGHLTLQQAGTKVIKSLRVHLPFPVGFNNFIQTTKFGKIGCSTNNCSAFIGGLVNSRDSWASQNMIQVGSLPSLTQTFTIMFPIVVQSAIKLSQVTLSFIQSDGQVGGVYRINGSSTSQYLSGLSNYISLPWTPVTPWTATATQWVNQPTIHSYKQSIDLSAIVPFSVSNTINMGTTVMPAADTLPSSTFASAYLNIFSDFSNPLVDNLTKCVNPFPYTYTNSYQVWVLWCPLRAGAVNQILFKYPLYPDSFGANFPFSTVFSYAYADTAGKMIGYRVQTNTTGGVAQTCTTQKTTTYDKNSNNPQENQYIITVSPFQLSPITYNKFLVSLTMPSLIPVTLIGCRAVETSQSVQLGCAKIAQASNVFKMELTYSGLTPMKVFSIGLILKTIKTNTATIVTINPYSVTISLPFTDGAGLPTFAGVAYSPYSSLISSCFNSFTFSSVSSQQFIYLTAPQLQSVSSSFYGALEFKASFSNSRSTLFQSSQLVITFSQPILTPYSRCTFTPNSHFFSSSAVDASNKIMTLLVSRNFADFTFPTYTVKCTQIISNGNNIMINMLWKDGIYNIQTTSANVTAMHTNINSALTTIAGTLLSKSFNAAGYRAEYMLRLTLATTTADKVQMWVEYPNNHVHSSFLECQYLKGAVWAQVMCIPMVKDVEDGLYIEFVASTSANVQFKVYGVEQAKLAPTTIKVLIKKTNINTGVSQYYISNIADTLANVIASNPIQIIKYQVDSIPSVAVVYSMPIAYSGNFYARIDELFRLQSMVTLACMINTTTVPCTRVRPDLVLIASTLSHGASYTNTLNVSVLTYIYNQKYDTDCVHFSIFIASTTADTVLYGSHSHLQTMLLTSSLLPPLALIWQIPTNAFNQVSQIVYIGYYGPPAKLITSSGAPFLESFIYNYTSTLPVALSILDLSAQLGTNYDQAYIGTLDPSYLGYSNLQFRHNSSYRSMPDLPIYISSDKCTLTTEFTQYNIISGGRTIPIAINISACRPMDTLSVELAINSPYMAADSALSTDFVYPSSDMIYVVVSHTIASVTVGQTYQLQILLKSNNSIVQNAYNTIKNVTIRIADRNLLIGNPQGKQPVINYITQNSASFAVQCNTPATIYWGIGVYPTMLGIRVEEIEARLIEKSNGLMQYSLDIYSWSHQIYGLDYVNDFNIDKNITIDGLEGGLQYVFKYFCIDQTGKASGGKISIIDTLPSNYSLMKVTLSFSSMLTYTQVNSIACAISEQLIIPYNQTISSVHSNCINNSQVYHLQNSTFYDQISSATNAPYKYFFYVDTNKITTRSITTTLASSLGTNKAFMNALLPYYTSMRVDSLLNLYEPIIYKVSLDIRKTQFTITVNVGLANTYLIAAIMNSHFDPVTMSKPTHYLMKEGFFSLNKKFDQIISVYGRDTISGTFSNLAQGRAYSVFYFVTVDNSALNSRTSQVLYKDLVTNKYQYIDLSQIVLTVSVLMAFFIVLSL